MTELRIYLTCDVDQDNANTTAERTALRWRGIEQMPAADQAMRSRGIRHTFFVRIDNQIRDVYGSYLAMYERHRSLWESLGAAGSEPAWHAHLYEARDGAYVALRDPEACSRILREAWAEVAELNVGIRAVRLGEAWHSSPTMRTLDALGLGIDSTAVPGRRRSDDIRCFDWLPTPNHPYHPSREDYRVPGTGEALSILELPMTTWPIQTDYDKAPLRRYLNPTFHPHLFRTWLEGFIASLAADERHDLVLIFHPDELLERAANGLHAFGLETFTANLDCLLQQVAGWAGSARFCCASEALR